MKPGDKHVGHFYDDIPSGTSGITCRKETECEKKSGKDCTERLTTRLVRLKDSTHQNQLGVSGKPWKSSNDNTPLAI